MMQIICNKTLVFMHKKYFEYSNTVIKNIQMIRLLGTYLKLFLLIYYEII